jgi:hypothetical protein
MAYAPTTNSPVQIFSNISSKIYATAVTGVAKFWQYNSADSLATVQGSGYFSNGKELGMQVGDIVFVSVSDVLKIPLQYVSAVNATTGAATVSSATA